MPNPTPARGYRHGVSNTQQITYKISPAIFIAPTSRRAILDRFCHAQKDIPWHRRTIFGIRPAFAQAAGQRQWQCEGGPLDLQSVALPSGAARRMGLNRVAKPN